MKKVRIKNYSGTYARYNGQIGTVIKDNSYIWTVEMPDGEEIMPYAPTADPPQCEIVTEDAEVTNYSIY